MLLSGIRVTMVHKLTDLSLGIFNGLTGLSSLHLVSNKLAKIRSDTFKNLHNLNNLPLAGNSFSIKEEVNKTSVTIDVSIDPNGTHTIVLLTLPPNDNVTFTLSNIDTIVVKSNPLRELTFISNDVDLTLCN